MAINRITIDSLHDYLDTIFGTKDYIWYRGESKDYKKTCLSPSLFRENGYNELGMFYEFRCAHYSKYSNYNNFQWLCLMQHYDLPTRLLDWTSNPLIALYFASCNDNTNGIVYTIAPHKLNKASDIDGLVVSDDNNVKARAEMVFTIDAIEILKKPIFHELDPNESTRLVDHLKKFGNYPIAIFPEKTNLRMATQSSCFTIHGGKQKETNQPPVHITNIPNININAYIIKKESKRKIRNQLSLLDINKARIFPEIEYTSQHLKDKYKQ